MVKKNRMGFSIIKIMSHFDQKGIVAEIFYSSLEAVDPYESVKRYTGIIHSAYQNANYKRLLVISFGKAACSMARAMEDLCMGLIDAGILLTKYGHCAAPYTHKKIRVYEAGHPIPDENGESGTYEIIGLLKNADEHTFITCLISGGGSALLVSPSEGITLDEKKRITRLLLKAGADIHETNTVRKHISRVKGGRLAELAYPAKTVSLILSDVIGDRFDVIASGPTSPDDTRYRDALNVLEKYNLIKAAPASIVDFLRKGVNGLIPETPKKGDKVFEHVENIIIGSNRIALTAAREKAEDMELCAEIISSEITGEAKEVGKWLAKQALERKASGIRKGKGSLCIISGGETTVTVKGAGEGGRNMELALSFAMEIKGIDGITLLSAGTDGTDGPTDAAGAIVDGQTFGKAKAAGLDPEEYLKNNDSYNFFKKINGLFITGPTGTNVMDMQIMMIE